MFKFIHAADIHLDSPLKGLEQYEGAPVEEIRGAARRALENLIDLALEEQVAFVLVAGDFYDGDWRDYNTGLYFLRQMNRLREANIPAYLIAGNHDAANRMTKSLALPDHLHLLSPQAPETRQVPGLDVAIHGQSFATQAVYENLSSAYPPACSGQFNIGLLHTCATSQDHDRYAPCSVNDLQIHGYDYWALGHVHLRQTLSESPWIGFCGNLQGRHIRETGPKGCLLVTVHDDHQQITNTFVPLDVLRWERATIAVDQVQSGEEVLDRVHGKLEFLQGQAEGRMLAVRIELSGTTPAHRLLAARKYHWMQEIRSLANSVGQGNLWIEKIKLHTSSPALETATEAVPDSALGELRNLFSEARKTPSLLTDWNYTLEDLRSKLPGELKSLVDSGEDDWLKERLNEAEAYLLGELLQGEEESE